MFMVLMECFLFDLQIGRLVAIFEGREDSKCRVVCSIVEDKNKEVMCGQCPPEHHSTRRGSSEPEFNQTWCDAGVTWSGEHYQVDGWC